MDTVGLASVCYIEDVLSVYDFLYSYACNLALSWPTWFSSPRLSIHSIHSIPQKS